MTPPPPRARSRVALPLKSSAWASSATTACEPSPSGWAPRSSRSLTARANLSGRRPAACPPRRRPGPRRGNEVLLVRPRRDRIERGRPTERSVRRESRDGKRSHRSREGLNGRVGGCTRKGAGELALLVLDERPDVVVGIGIGRDVDARGASGRPRAPPRRDGGATARASGSGFGSGSGSGSGGAGARPGRSGRRSRSRSYAARRILSLVISSFDDWSLACGGARRRGGGFSALSLFERAREGRVTRSCQQLRVSRTAVSFCCRRIALTMAACFSALTAMSARRRDSLTSARSCEGAEGGEAGVAAQLCFRTTGGREGAVYRTFPLWRASSWLATISRCWIA